MKKVLLSLVVAAFGFVGANADSYTIQFKADINSNNQGAAISTTTALADVIQSGTEYVASFSDLTQAYQACNYGMKIGANKQAGKITINLSEAGIVNASKIEVYASASKNPTFQKLKVNDTEFSFVAGEVTSSFKVCAIEPNSQIDNIVLAKTNASSTSSQQGFIFIDKIVVTYDNSDTREPAGLAWSESSVTVLTTELADFTAPTLTNPNSVAVTYASDNTEVATVTEAGTVTLTGTKGTAKITASFVGNESYKPQEVSYTITVKAPLPVNTSSLENPYTVAEALAIIADLDGTTMNDVYVKGTVDANPEYTAQFGNMTYQIFDAPKSESAKTLTIFRGKYFDGEAFNAENQLKEGDEVIVKGNILNYGGTTPEMNANNVVVSLNGSTTPPAVEATEVNNVLATTALASGTPVKVNYALTVGYASGSNIFACDEDGDFIQLYGTNTLKAGDVIPAGWEGTYTLYGDNTPEITFNEGALPAATEGTFTPNEVEATAITDALVNHVVTVKNVNFEEATPATKTDFTGTVGETTLNLFNQYELASVEAGKYDVTGVVAIRTLNATPVAKLFVTSLTKSETDSALLIGAGDNAAPVEYYNLQGVRIDNPANGIFIRRQGSKAQKIVL